MTEPAASYLLSPVAREAEAFAELRAFLRALGLREHAVAGSYLYDYLHAVHGARRFATLHGGRRTATVYLYPDALGRSPGVATAFYRALDEAGLGMGSKAGPSIGIDLTDHLHLRLFCDGLRGLFT